MTKWDEHPWCGCCLAKAGIEICCSVEERDENDGEGCYLCDRMTDVQVRKFRESCVGWEKKVREQKRKDVKTRKIPEHFHCQKQCFL